MEIKYKTKHKTVTIVLDEVERRQFMSSSVAVEEVRRGIRRALDIAGVDLTHRRQEWPNDNIKP